MKDINMRLSSLNNSEYQPSSINPKSSRKINLPLLKSVTTTNVMRSNIKFSCECSPNQEGSYHDLLVHLSDEHDVECLKPTTNTKVRRMVCMTTKKEVATLKDCSLDDGSLGAVNEKPKLDDLNKRFKAVFHTATYSCECSDIQDVTFKEFSDHIGKEHFSIVEGNKNRFGIFSQVSRREAGIVENCSKDAQVRYRAVFHDKGVYSAPEQDIDPMRREKFDHELFAIEDAFTDRAVKKPSDERPDNHVMDVFGVADRNGELEIVGKVMRKGKNSFYVEICALDVSDNEDDSVGKTSVPASPKDNSFS